MNKKIVDAINDIDDKYIEYAHKRFKFSNLVTWSNFGKLSLAVLCLFSLINLSKNIFMGSSSSSDLAKVDYASYDSNYYEVAEETAAYDMDNDYSNGTGTIDSSYVYNDSKLIVNASMRIETSKYDETIEDITAKLKQANGYAQSTSAYTSSNSNRYYEATLRIPSENYNSFIESLKADNSVSYYSESIDDITSSYKDLKARLDALKAQEQQVLEFYKQAQDIDDLMSIESRLSDLRYQIESIESQINNYDVLTTYATLNINIEESITHTTNSKFTDRLSNAFINGLNNFVSGIEDIILFASYHIILIVIVIVVVAIIIYKKKRRK